MVYFNNPEIAVKVGDSATISFYDGDGCWEDSVNGKVEKIEGNQVSLSGKDFQIIRFTSRISQS